jgi:hypothetical protein
VPKRLNLLGHRYGRLSVIAEAGLSPHGKTLWRCQCDCGTEKVVVGGDLRSGRTTSCGCFHQEVLDVLKESRTLRLENQRFGRLTAIRLEGHAYDGRTWLCKCDCGNHTIVSAAKLRSGNTKSCGCLRLANFRAPKSPEHQARITESLRDMWKSKGAQGGVHYNATINRWVVSMLLNGKTRHFGTFLEYEHAVRAAAEAQAVYKQNYRYLKDLPESDYRNYLFRIAAPWRLRNVYFEHRYMERQWVGQVRDKRFGRFKASFATEEEACLWAMHKKLELGHNGREKILRTIAEVEERMRQQAEERKEEVFESVIDDRLRTNQS